MHHKRKRAPSARAGCAMCKPQKKGKANPENYLGHRGFGKLRDLAHAKQDMTTAGMCEECGIPAEPPYDSGEGIYCSECYWNWYYGELG